MRIDYTSIAVGVVAGGVLSLIVHPAFSIAGGAAMAYYFRNK